MKRGSTILGLIVGLLLPLAGVFVIYLFWGHHEGIGNFLKDLTVQRGLASKVLTLGLFLNALPFAYCNIKRIDNTMRGIFVASMLYAVLIVLVMFVW